VKLIEKERPLVREAYDVLGAARVEELNYHLSNIKKEIIKRTDAGNSWKIAKMVIEQIGLLNEIKISKAKEILKGIYAELGISSNAKGTDLEKIFYTKYPIRNAVRYIVLQQSKIADNIEIN
jgi:hypothetical protein